MLWGPHLLVTAQSSDCVGDFCPNLPLMIPTRPTPKEATWTPPEGDFPP